MSRLLETRLLALPQQANRAQPTKERSRKQISFETRVWTVLIEEGVAVVSGDRTGRVLNNLFPGSA